MSMSRSDASFTELNTPSHLHRHTYNGDLVTFYYKLKMKLIYLGARILVNGSASTTMIVIG